MNRNQAIALAIATANLALLLLFPPFDQYSIANSKLPVFGGFYFYFAPPQYGVVNTGVLTIAAFVVLINLAIAWLLLRDAPAGTTRRRLSVQSAILVFTGLNLVLVLLFPPFESVFALTKAMIPTFEGFFFIFDRKPIHTIVTTLLYLEVVFVLANGAILWLIFNKRRPPTEEEIAAAAAELGGLRR